MQRKTIIRAIDRIPRALSFLGLAGLLGLWGVVDERYYALSSLSFLSYLAYFRFLNGFLGAPVSIKKERLPLYVASMCAPLILFIPLARGFYIPALGFLGFLGFLSFALGAHADIEQDDE